jgi:poly(ribitol-phosphate) beta-N-acetylglucosaminyltransferase
MPAGTTAQISVSVVVPVYNPGSSIESCIESLLAQSVPVEQLELVFVDDGSTDGVSDRLDRLAKQHTHVQVIHQPNSGWAGKPRNVGIAAATGRYVQFVDQDDTLGEQALERLTSFADDNDADIVISKVTSNFRSVPHDVWAEDVARCSIHNAPLIDSLTPHKMFRRAFLLAHDLRFPEGRRRLEDQHFMVASYFATDRVAILGDYPCYFYNARPDGENAGAAALEPVGYYGNLREVLDIVEANTEPGSFRDDLLRRFLRDVLSRINKVSTNEALPQEYVAEVFREARAVTIERFPESVRDGLPSLQRQRAAALVDDRLDIVADSGRRAAGVRAEVTLDEPAPTGNAWRLHVTAHLVHADGQPVTLLPEGDSWILDPRLTPGEFATRPDTTDEILRRASAIVSLHERDSAVEWPAPAKLMSRLEPIDSGNTAHRLVLEGDVEIDPATIAGGARLDPGIWRVMLRIRGLGISRTPQLRLANAEILPAIVLRPRPTAVRLRNAGDSSRLVVAVKLRVPKAVKP